MPIDEETGFQLSEKEVSDYLDHYYGPPCRPVEADMTDDDLNEEIDEDALDDYLSPCTHCGDGECDGECLEEEVSDYLDQFYPEVKNERI